MSLHIQQLSFERNNRYLFKNLCADLHPGECLQIQGANGSGKSTALKLLATLLRYEEGDIAWKKESIQTILSLYRNEFHYLGHLNAHKPTLTVYETISYWLAYFNLSLSFNDIHLILKKFKLHLLENRLTSELSAGQLRRLALTRLLLIPRVLWILDEPTTALDAEGIEFCTDVFNEHLKNNGMIIVATHHALDLKGAKKCWSL